MMVEYCGNIPLDEMLEYMEMFGVKGFIERVQALEQSERKTLKGDLRSKRDLVKFRVTDTFRLLAETWAEGRMDEVQTGRYEDILRQVAPYIPRATRWRIKVPSIVKEQLALMESHNSLRPRPGEQDPHNSEGDKKQNGDDEWKGRSGNCPTE